MPQQESHASTRLAPDRAELFDLRVERWEPDLRAGLEALFSADAAAVTEQRLLERAAQALARRPDDLYRLDRARTLRPDWFQLPRMIGYAAYTERFSAGALDDVRDRIPYLRELGVTYLHLMPLLQPRDGDSDGGYAVADYRRVRPDLGTMDDLESLARDLRAQGISMVLDLVLNHVAREHEWAQAARAGDDVHRSYFHVFADRDDPDAYERTLLEVFPDFAPGNFTWDDELSGWVWTTFNAFQWDLNWSNPDVLVEFAEIVFDLANRGVEVLRLDAIAFLWKRLGTDCQNQPEVHAVAQVLRALTRIACPGVLLKAEAIVSPDELIGYLGRGERHGRVSDLAYHNTLMVQIWSMLATRDVRLTVQALRRLPAAPDTTAWITYLRCHDDIGWAIDDTDAASVGLNGPAHRSFLSDYYIGAFPGSDARGLTFQYNAATGDRRVSGTAAALTGLDAARDSGDEAAIGLGIARILLAYAIVLGWGGIPVLWSGDELGAGNDPWWAGEAGHQDDNRWTHRPRLDADQLAQRHDPDTVVGRVHAGLRRLVEVRAGLPSLHARIATRVLEPSDPGVLILVRTHPEGTLVELFNVTETWRPVPAHRLAELGCLPARDTISDTRTPVGEDGNVWLEPYGARWLVVAH